MKILIMRPSQSGKELANNLNKIGIDAWHFPLFDFHPSTSAISLLYRINQLYQSDIILVFSKKSIYYTNLYLKSNNLEWPSFPKYYAIGKSTASFLSKYIKKTIVFPHKKENSENLLKILHQNQLKNNKIVLLQGENGRKLIKNNFIEKKIKFSVIECYRKVLKEINFSLEEKKWRLFKINSLVVTSGEVLRELNNIISNIHQFRWLFQCKLFVVGQRIERIARNLGWKDIIVSSYANNEYFLKIINKYRNEQNFIFWSAKEDLNL